MILPASWRPSSTASRSTASAVWSRTSITPCAASARAAAQASTSARPACKPAARPCSKPSARACSRISCASRLACASRRSAASLGGGSEGSSGSSGKLTAESDNRLALLAVLLGGDHDRPRFLQASHDRHDPALGRVDVALALRRLDLHLLLEHRRTALGHVGEDDLLDVLGRARSASTRSFWSTS